MRLSELELVRFRNLVDQKIALPERVTLVVGSNGQGKTSLLEAIYLLSHGKSFRHGQYGELVRWRDQCLEPAADNCIVDGLFETAEGSKRLKFSIESGARTVSINHKKIRKASSFYGQTASIVFTPDDLQLVKGPPALRRKFLDSILSMVDGRYVDNLVQYQRALKSRNAVLHLLKKRNDSGGEDQQSSLFAWNSLLASHGVPVTKSRVEILKELRSALSSYYNSLTGSASSDETLSEAADCRFDSQLVDEEKVLSVESIEETYRQRTAKDIAQQATTFGPHRDDIELLLKIDGTPRNARKTASQGQARGIALALKLAATDVVLKAKGEPPILLLDDVESELDPARRTALYRLLAELDTQVILTATEVSSGFSRELPKATILQIDQGRVVG